MGPALTKKILSLNGRWGRPPKYQQSKCVGACVPKVPLKHAATPRQTPGRKDGVAPAGLDAIHPLVANEGQQVRGVDGMRDRVLVAACPDTGPARQC